MASPERTQEFRYAVQGRNRLRGVDHVSVGQVPQVRRTRHGEEPGGPFIDPEGYRAYIDTAEERFRSGVVH